MTGQDVIVALEVERGLTRAAIDRMPNVVYLGSLEYMTLMSWPEVFAYVSIEHAPPGRMFVMGMVLHRVREHSHLHCYYNASEENPH